MLWKETKTPKTPKKVAAIVEDLLVYCGHNEEDYLYCLPDSREIDVCRVMMDNMGYPKLEQGLCAMPEGDLTDCLTYKNLKVTALLFISTFTFIIVKEAFD